MDAFFAELGRTILSKWKAKNFSLEHFPAIAQAALDKRSPAKHADLTAFIRDFLLGEEQPVQTDSPFGEPEIVAYANPRFYIQLLFWMDGTTAIHQHEFSGAFHVMRGSSIHAHYEFENAKAVTPYLRVGDVKMKSIELLEAGRTVQIISGRKTIHSLFHLDSPSVTVVVRTQHDPGTGPQLNYLPPGIAIDPHFSDTLMLRRKQLLDVLEQAGDAGYASLVLEMIADLDFERGFSVLHGCMEYLQQIDQWDAAVRAFGKKHGALATGVAATLKEEFRRNVIKGYRRTVTEPEHRFFLALLMNVTSRDDLLKLVAKRFSKAPPVETVMRWAEELTDITDDGAAILDATFPEAVRVEFEAQPTTLLAALRAFINPTKKVPAELRGLSVNDVKALRAAFAESTLNVLTN